MSVPESLGSSGRSMLMAKWWGRRYTFRTYPSIHRGMQIHRSLGESSTPLSSRPCTTRCTPTTRIRRTGDPTVEQTPSGRPGSAHRAPARKISTCIAQTIPSDGSCTTTLRPFHRCDRQVREPPCPQRIRRRRAASRRRVRIPPTPT
jgi:hypothetical protein